MDMPLADQIASAYDLPHAQARGIVVMMESKVEAERERCAKLVEALAEKDFGESTWWVQTILDELAGNIRSPGGPHAV